MSVLMTAIFLGALDGTMVNTALPAMGKDLLPSAAEVLWMVDGYSLAIAASLVSCATAGDRWGRKPVFLAGLALFAGVCAVAGTTSHPVVLVCARIVQGVAAAMIVSSVVATIRVIFTDQRARTLAYGLWTAALSVGLAAGPVLGGVLVQDAGWRWAFLVNVPVALAAVVLGGLWVQNSRAAAASYGGALSLILSVAGLGAVVYALQNATDFSPVAAACGITGAGCLAWFTRRQLRAAVPLLELRLFRSRPFTLAAVSILVSYGSYAGLLFLLSQRLQLADGATPLRAGLTIVPFAAAIAAGGLLSPWWARLSGRPAAVMTGMLLQAAALAWLALVPGWLTPALIAMGLGTGVVATLAADLLMSSAPAAKAGQAGAIQETAFALGSGVGVAVLGTIATLTFRSRLSGIPHAGNSLAATIDRAAALAPAARSPLLHAATSAFTTGYTVALVTAAVSLTAVAAIVFATARRATAPGRRPRRA